MMRFVLLALALLSAPAHADDLFYRLYPVDAAKYLDRPIPGTALNLILQDTSAEKLAEAQLIQAKAAAANVLIVYGFRLMESKPAGGWADAARWQRNADSLAKMIDALGIKAGDLMPLDEEDYRGAMPMPSEAEFLMAAKPFLDVARARGIKVAIYPADLRRGPITWIVDALCPSGEVVASSTVAYVRACRHAELWTELNFGVYETLRDPMKVGSAYAPFWAFEAEAARRWPGIRVRHGVFDRALRPGLVAPSMLAQLRERGFDWAFDLDRVAADKAQLGSPDWMAGTRLHSSNDISHAWRFSPLSQGPTPSVPSGLPMTFVGSSNLAARKDLRSTLGALVTGGQHFYASQALPRVSSTFSLSLGVAFQEGGFGPVVGACTYNSESWQVTLTSRLDPEYPDTLVLELRQGAGKKLVVPVLRNPPRFTAMRLVLVLDGSTWTVQVTGGERVVVVPTVAVTSGGGNVYLAYGTAVVGRNAAGVIPVQTFNGLIPIDLDVTKRAWTPSEAAAALKLPFPRVQ